MAPTITEVETVEFTHPLDDVRYDRRAGLLAHAPGETHERTTFALRIRTDEGVAGEYVGGTAPGFAQVRSFAPALVGENPLRRERVWTDAKRALRAYDGMGIGPIDIALWDFAGKYRDAPVHELLGTYRERLPAYASTYFGTEGGRLGSPDDYADFAEECLDRGFPAFKIHPVLDEAGGDAERDAATVRAVGERVGDGMDLMMDPVCAYDAWADALRVGRACDEAGFFWYEDPYRDGGVSQHGHRKLKERLDTPLLQTEMVRGVEAHADFAAADATDLLRADPAWDGGVTGAMKIARAAEGFGLDVEFHLAGPVQRHCMAATRNSNYYELGLMGPGTEGIHAEPPVYAEYTDDPGGLDADGTVGVPDGPGLGVDYDWDYVEDHAVDRRTFD